jgi:hypothetical protein
MMSVLTRARLALQMAAIGGAADAEAERVVAPKTPFVPDKEHRMREAGLPRAWIPKIGIHGGEIAYKSRRWCVFKAAMAWGALGAAVIASTVYSLAPEFGFLMIVPLEFTGVYTAALFAELVLRRREEQRWLSRSILDQRELLKEELEENLAILRGLGLSTEQMAEEQLRIFREFRLRRSRLLTRQIAQHGLRRGNSAGWQPTPRRARDVRRPSRQRAREGRMQGCEAAGVSPVKERSFTQRCGDAERPPELRRVRRHQLHHDRLLRVQTVLGLVEDAGARALDHGRGHLLAAVGGEAVEEDGAL